MNPFRPLDTKRQQRFYDRLAQGEARRGLWGLDKRFSPDAADASPSFERHFVRVLAPLLRPDMRLLDVGCGPGIYFPLLAPHCASVTGAELSPEYASLAIGNARRAGVENVSLTVQDSTRLGFGDGAFDAVLCVDTLHHVFDLDATLAEIERVLKPGGDVFVFEPNCLNPALLALCMVDRNEWGAVARCYRRRYERVFARRFERVASAYNGLLIGPQGRLSTWIADRLLDGPLAAVTSRLSPKIFFHLRKPAA